MHVSQGIDGFCIPAKTIGKTSKQRAFSRAKQLSMPLQKKENCATAFFFNCAVNKNHHREN